MLLKNIFSRSKQFAGAALLGLAVSFSPALKAAENPSPASRTYRNPLIPDRDIADPDVLKMGDQYYLYATTRGRGYEVFVSRDLVNWKNKGIAFHDLRGGDWAPDLFYNERGDKKIYLYYTDTDTNLSRSYRGKQIGVAVADSPLGQFKDKGVLANIAIDAHLFQDDDGKFYLYYVDLSGGFKIMAQPMSDPLTKSGEAKKVIHPTELWEKISGEVTEGPFMLKRNGIYYLMFSGTGADSPNYGIGYATSKSPMGPFVKYAGNPIAHRTDKIFGPGHHCVVETPDKKLWMIYHQKKTDDMSWPRFLAIDPIWFDDKGVLHAKISKNTDEPAPEITSQIQRTAPSTSDRGSAGLLLSK